MNLYVVRHGETNWNKEKRMQGQTDIPLNEKGILQAYEVKEKLKDIKFDICYCSPLQRAKKTADIIVEDKCPIIYNDLFKERFLGELEGTTFESYLEMAKYWDYSTDLKDKNVESVKEILKRGQEALDFIDEEYDNVLLVSHGAFIKAMNYCILGYDENTDFGDFHLQNCEYKKYEL